MNIFNIFKKKPESDVVILSEAQAKAKIKEWKGILQIQADAIDKIAAGMKFGTSWLTDLPTRTETAKTEMQAIKDQMKTSGSEDALLLLGKRYISKDRLIKNLTVAKKSMEGNLKLAELQYNRLQDKAVDLATKIQESEVYLSLSGSLEVARKYIQDIEEPAADQNREAIIQYKSLVTRMDAEDDIEDDEVKKLFRKEFNRVSRGEVRSNSKSVKTSRKGKTGAKRTVR